jgi:DNA-binding NarL/FixJ family response regulator
MIRIVVVDDHAVVRRGLASMLSTAADIECVGTAADGPAALDLIQRLQPDVVLLDLSMPGESGIDLMRDLRKRDLDVRVLVLTSFSDPDLVLDAVHAGADGYLLKQSEAETIIDAVRAVAAGASPFDPTVARWLVSSVRDRSRTEPLTDRERQVLELVRQGQPNKSIARRLGISERTVKAHVTQILQRIGVSGRTQAALWAERNLPEDGIPEGNL